MNNLTIVPFLYQLNAVILNPIIRLAFAVAGLYFIYGIVMFLKSDSVDKTRKDAQNAIFWGIIGMVIMFSVYGIIAFVIKTFGIAPSEIPDTAQQFIKP